MPVTTRSQKNSVTATAVPTTSSHPMTTRSRAATGPREPASTTTTTTMRPKRMTTREQQKEDIDTIVAKILVSMRYRA